MILDCTLRDGGYINNWNFGKENIFEISKGLIEANVDFLECGYLKYHSTLLEDEDNTIYGDFTSIDIMYGELELQNTKLVAMINFGDYPIDEVPSNNGILFGIRLAFHKKNYWEAIEYATLLKNKGYNVFVQPMVTTDYNLSELRILLEKVSELRPYAIYIVDSFGVMTVEKVVEMSRIFQNELHESIKIGYHGHNNMQLAFSNSIQFDKIMERSRCIIDSSIYGMGRGAGNLNTELIMSYLTNLSTDHLYKVSLVVKLIDNIISPFFDKYRWGYSLPYLISARYHCHPNYATYLINKQTIRIDEVEHIISNIKKVKKVIYDESYIKNLYFMYKDNNVDDIRVKGALREDIGEQSVLLVGPGQSVISNGIKQHREILNKSKVISVNYKPDFHIDYLFISNSKRFSQIQFEDSHKLLITSNIPCDVGMKLNYSSLVDSNDNFDSSLVMCLNLLKCIGVEKVYLIGFDGYLQDDDLNYASDNLKVSLDRTSKENLNKRITRFLNNISDNMELVFLEKSQYI